MSEQARTTRDRVRSAVSQDGPITARELSEQLDLTPAAVRRHLDALAAQRDVHLWLPHPSAALWAAWAGRCSP